MTQAPMSHKDPAWDKAEKEASARTGVPVEVLRAIRLHGESTDGDQVSPVGARGVYQFMPATERLFRKKYGVSAYSPDATEQATAAAYHLKESYARTKDWGLAAAGYNGGPAVEKNPRGNKETSAYYDRVVAALPLGLRGPNPEAGGTAGAAFTPDVQSPTKRLAPSFDDFMAGRGNPGAGAPVGPTVQAGPALAIAAVTDDSDAARAARELSTANKEEQAKADAQTFGSLKASERFGLLNRDTTLGAFYSDTLAPMFSAYDKFGMPDDQDYMRAAAADSRVAFRGVESPTDDEQESLMGARSPAERDAIAFRLNTGREDRAVQQRAGTAEQLLAGLTVGAFDPTTYLAGFGAAKAFYAAGRGAVALAKQGKFGAAVYSSAGENILGNVAYEAVRHGLGEHRSISDYGLAAATGIFPLALSVPGLKIAATKYHADVANAVLARQEVFIGKASAQLGEAAEPAAIRKLAAQLEHEDAMVSVAAVRAGVNKLVAPDLNDPTLQAQPKPPTTEHTPAELRSTLAEIEQAMKLDGSMRAYAQAKALAARPDDPLGELQARLAGGGRTTAADVGLARKAVEDAWLEANVRPDAPRKEHGPTPGGDTQTPRIVRSATEKAVARGEPIDATLAAVRRVLTKVGIEVTPEIELRVRRGHEALTTLAAAERRQFDTETDWRSLRDDELAQFHADTAQRAKDSTELFQTPWQDPNYIAKREDSMEFNADSQARWLKATDGELDYKAAKQLPEGVTLTNKAKESPQLRHISGLIKELWDTWMPGRRLVVSTETLDPVATGVIISQKQASVIGLRNGTQGQMQHTVMHEIGHAVYHEHVQNVPPELLERVVQEWNEFRAALADGKIDEALNRRFAATGMSRQADSLGSSDYILSFDEHTAEQFVKYLQDKLARGVDVGVSKKWSDSIVNAVKDLVKYVLGLERQGHIKPGKAAEEMFDWILENSAKRAKESEGFLDPGLRLPDLASFSKGAPVHRIDIEYGLTALSGDDPQTQMKRKMLREIIGMAEEEMKANPIDKEKTKTIMKNSLFNMATPGLRLALSEHPVSQWISRHLVENAMGGSGRGVTAAMRKAQYELEFVGNGNLVYDQAYESWKGSRGVGPISGTGNDIFRGDLLGEFDSLVGREIENRRWGKAQSTDPNVLKAADAHQVQYERMLEAQKANKTVGWSTLPEDSWGYMPHNFNAGKLGSLSNVRRESMRLSIKDQMVTFMDFDEDFAEKLSGAYMNHARTNANGGHEIPANVLDPHAPEYIMQAAQAAGMTKAEIDALGRKLAAGGASHTKRRLNLDLTKEYTDAEGTYTLMDMMDTDLRSLLRNQARRVSGEVAVTQQGVQGSAGLKLLEEAMHYTKTGKVDKDAVEAMQQVSAELLGRPYGEQMPTLMEGAMTANAAASLGQMVIAQVVETSNMATALGLQSTINAALSLPRLIGEVRKLARGERVDGLLSSMEVPGGEFGTEGYKLVTRFDSPSAMYDTVGRDQLSALDKLIRAGGHSLGKLSFHRILQAAQVRASAEQITLKALRYIRDGIESKALADMGFDPELRAAIKDELPLIAQFDGNGRVLKLDMTKAQNREAVEAFITKVHRGNAQIIQRTHIGEIGKWQHNNIGKVLTQFRTYPITAMEKQWGRQRGLHGAGAAIGMVIAIAPFAVPIYLAKVALNAQGRDDPDAYIDKMTTPLALARGTMNYLGLLGLAPDYVDAMTAAPWIGEQIKSTLGGEDNKRPGTAGGLGSIVPLVGRADRTLQALQGQGGAKSLVQSLPFSNLPYTAPVVNALPTEW